MNKRLLLLSLLVLWGFNSISQTIVSTTPENKKVILEEFTGLHCVFCPDGHAIANTIKNSNPGEVFLVNIHVGSFANPSAGEPDFRTPFGTAIASQSGLTGYPAGTVNRHIFPGQSQSGGNDTAMGRNNWTSASNQTLGVASYVNLAVEADIDVTTNEVTVHVEAFYTDDSPVNTNMLNVVLLQNNTLGPQTGGNAGNEYVHQHRLVHMITGQWGESITPTTTGTFIDRTYNYTIPAMYNNVPAAIEDMELVVFMTETTQELISGNGAFPTFSNFQYQNDAFARYVEEIDVQCGFDITPSVNIQNTGENTLTTLDIDYSINGGATQSFTWNGNLTSLQNETVELPAISYTIDEINTVEVSIADDDDNSNNITSATFDRSVIATNEVNLLLNTDNFGGQCTWEILNMAGTVVESGGPYGNNETINESFTLAGDCYEFNVYDSAGNGGGSVVLFDGNNEILFSSPGDYGSGESSFFGTDGLLASGDANLSNVAIYPNPASTIVHIVNAEQASVEVFDILGKIVVSEDVISANQKINVSALTSGTYFIKISKETKVSVEKLIITQ
jgi:hypothetical protein